MKMLALSLLLLASPPSIFPAVPFYCRRFKANCAVRRDSICCREEYIVTTEKELDIVIEELSKNKESEVDLVASSSIIEEVVVAPEETLVQNNLIVVSTTAKPGRPIPRFCKLLKFDCKKRSNPICCKDETSEIEQKEKVSEREELIESDTAVAVTSAVNKTQISKNVEIAPDKIDKADHKSTEVFLGRNSVSPSKRKNNFILQRSSSLFSKRPRFGKSSLCKIVNCSKAHNKKHKCCRVEENKSDQKSTPEVKSIKIVTKVLKEETKADAKTTFDEEINYINETRNSSHKKDGPIIGLKRTQDFPNELENKTVDEEFKVINSTVALEEETTTAESRSQDEDGEEMKLQNKETFSQSHKQSIDETQNTQNNDNKTYNPHTQIVDSRDAMINNESTQNYEVTVTEAFELDTATIKQELNTLKVIKIENEPSLFDSIMYQLLNYNVSNFNSSEENQKVFPADESQEDISVMNDENNTDSYTTATVLEETTDDKFTVEYIGVDDEKETVMLNLVEDGLTSTIFPNISDETERTVEYEMSTTEPEVDFNAAVETVTVLPVVFSEVSGNIDNSHDFNESDNIIDFTHNYKNELSNENDKSMNEEKELLEVGSSNKVYVDRKVPKKERSYAGNLIPESSEKKSDGSNNQPVPYTVISLPGYSNLRQPFVLQYPGMVTATITRVSKSFSWL